MERRRTTSRLYWAVGLLATLTGCGFEPFGEEPFDPPAVYREWWAKTEACSGRTGDFDRVRWSVVEGRSFSCSSGQCAGHWRTDHHIFLASDWVMDEMVVRHEMLHDLLNRTGHPDPPFGQPCPLTWESWNGGAAGLNLAQRPPVRID
jgi:hypothetical protein